jgi:hypothetical protein
MVKARAAGKAKMFMGGHHLKEAGRMVWRIATLSYGKMGKRSTPVPFPSSRFIGGTPLSVSEINIYVHGNVEKEI